jgi:hypothetical protein
MSAIEDSALTLARLLRTKMRVVKDDGGLASVIVSGEWLNSDAFKGYDGQVTVGLAECIEQKLDLTGKNRRRMPTLRVNVWTTDMPNAAENGKSMRNKIVEEINRVIHQNQTSPNATVYDYVGASSSSLGCRAFSGDSEAAPSADWSELCDSDYQKLWYSDDNYCLVSASESGKYGVLLFGFKLESAENSVERLIWSFEGYGTAPGANGVTVKAWNHTAGIWQNTQTNQAHQSDAAVAITLAANLPDYIDDEGYVWFLARTNGASDGEVPAVLNCDYSSCAATVNGIGYCDVASYRILDRTDIKPFIYRTEFTIKSWFIQNTGE